MQTIKQLHSVLKKVYEPFKTCNIHVLPHYGQVCYYVRAYFCAKFKRLRHQDLYVAFEKKPLYHTEILPPITNNFLFEFKLWKPTGDIFTCEC